MNDPAKEIGMFIRTERKRHGLSQEAVAYRVGVEQSEISKIERGKGPTRPGLLKRIAEVLDLPDDAIGAYLK